MADAEKEAAEREIGELTLGGQGVGIQLATPEDSTFSLAGTELATVPTTQVFLVHKGTDKTPFQMWYVYRGVRYGPQPFQEGPKCTSGNFDQCAQNGQRSYMGLIPCNVQIQLVTVDCQMNDGSGVGVANLRFSFTAACGMPVHFNLN